MSATINLTRKEQLLAELASNIANPPARVPAPSSDPTLARFNALGTELWLDTGVLEEAQKLWRSEMSALTTNNTLANQVVQTGVMDDAINLATRSIKELEPGISDQDLILDVVFVVNCHIALRLVHAFDAMVSVELHPAVSHDIDKTLRYAQRYIAIRPDRFIVKIPLTPEGFCGVARARAENIPINYTLGFSARQNHLAARLSKPSYVNVFLGRLNNVVSENGLGDGKNVGEKTTLASQASVRAARAESADITTRQIAASMRSAEQMLSLAGLDVFTIPPKAVEEFYTQHHATSEIVSHVDDTYEVELAPGTDASVVERLWTIDERFEKLTKDLVRRGGVNLTGEDLREADRDHGTKLFANFTAAEQVEIREKGKIPEVARWTGRASLDDLMTEAALQSFTKDQKAFDDRILEIAAKA